MSNPPSLKSLHDTFSANLPRRIINLKQKPPVFQKTMTPFNGGTGLTEYNDGDIFIGEAPVVSILPIGDINQNLTINKLGNVNWSNDIISAKQKLISYDLINVYNTYQNEVKTTLDQYAQNGINVLQIEEDTSFVTTNSKLTSNNITKNTNQLKNSSNIVSSLETIVVAAKTKMNNISSNLVTLDTNISNTLSNLVTEKQFIDTLDTDLSTLNISIGNVYSNITSDITFKNMIVNGDFQIWQRRTSYTGPATISYPTADHWYHSINPNVTLTSQKNSVTFGSGIGNTNSLRLTLSGMTSGYTIATAVENALCLQNSFATISMYSRCDNPQTLSITIVQEFGSGGSTAITVCNANFNITNQWARYSATFQMPNISNLVVGENSCIKVFIQTDSALSSLTNLDIALVQLENNISATNFSPRQYQIEEMLCKRYYEEGYSTWSGRATANLGVAITHSYSVTKYKTPTLNVEIINNVGFTNTATVGFMNNLDNGSIKITKNNISGHAFATVKYKAEAEII